MRVLLRFLLYLSCGHFGNFWSVGVYIAHTSIVIIFYSTCVVFCVQNCCSKKSKNRKKTTKKKQQNLPVHICLWFKTKKVNLNRNNEAWDDADTLPRLLFCALLLRGHYNRLSASISNQTFLLWFYYLDVLFLQPLQVSSEVLVFWAPELNGLLIFPLLQQVVTAVVCTVIW